MGPPADDVGCAAGGRRSVRSTSFETSCGLVERAVCTAIAARRARRGRPWPPGAWTCPTFVDTDYLADLAFFDKSSLLILSNSFGGTYPMDEWSRWLL